MYLNPRHKKTSAIITLLILLLYLVFKVIDLNSSITESVLMLHGVAYIVYFLSGWLKSFNLWKYIEANHPEYASRPNFASEKRVGSVNVMWNDKLRKTCKSDTLLNEKVKAIKSLLMFSYIHFGLLIASVVLAALVNSFI